MLCTSNTACTALVKPWMSRVWLTARLAMGAQRGSGGRFDRPVREWRCRVRRAGAPGSPIPTRNASSAVIARPRASLARSGSCSLGCPSSLGVLSCCSRADASWTRRAQSPHPALTERQRAVSPPVPAVAHPKCAPTGRRPRGSTGAPSTRYAPARPSPDLLHDGDTVVNQIVYQTVLLYGELLRNPSTARTRARSCRAIR